MHTSRGYNQQPQRREIELALPTLPGAPELGVMPIARGAIRVLHGGKAPRLAFQPGSFVRLDGKLLAIICAFRLADEPHVWRFYCEERESLEPVAPTDPLMAISHAVGATGEDVPRVVSHLFLGTYDVVKYFEPIYKYADWRLLTTADLKRGTVVSDGEVLPPKADEALPQRPELTP